jgi:hypothetical protein
MGLDVFFFLVCEYIKLNIRIIGMDFWLSGYKRKFRYLCDIIEKKNWNMVRDTLNRTEIRVTSVVILSLTTKLLKKKSFMKKRKTRGLT